MKPSKKKKLEKAGFRVGTVQEFLKLSDQELALIDLKISLIRTLKSMRLAAGVTQQRLAKLIGSSQSRIAKMESVSPDISLDLICKALLAIGLSRRRVGKIIAAKAA